MPPLSDTIQSSLPWHPQALVPETRIDAPIQGCSNLLNSPVSASNQYTSYLDDFPLIIIPYTCTAVYILGNMDKSLPMWIRWSFYPWISSILSWLLESTDTETTITARGGASGLAFGCFYLVPLRFYFCTKATYLFIVTLQYDLIPGSTNLSSSLASNPQFWK